MSKIEKYLFYFSIAYLLCIVTDTRVQIWIGSKPEPSHANEITPDILSDIPDDDGSLFDEAVKLIKEFEGLHSAEHYCYVGYGHRLLKGETFTADITESVADSILRDDLMQKCAHFRQFGKDSLLLGVLAYNVGEYTLLGSKENPKSNLIKKLESGNRDIYNEYCSYRNYKGQVIPSLERRRKNEYKLLFITD